MTVNLLTPILNGGINNTHYFNGRLLTADALRNEQMANRQQRQQLGRALGSGIVEGLSVSLEENGAEPVMAVTAGLALNREGAALALPQTAHVALVKAEDPLPTEAGLFEVCVAPATGVRHSGHHVYMLVLAPASGYRERAPMYDLASNGDSNGRANGCGYRYAVEGVQFRLVRVDLEDDQVVDAGTADALALLMDSGAAADQSKLRNWLAHLALGSVEADALTVDLFSYLGPDARVPSYGLADRLLVTADEVADADMTVHLSACDVPLALLYWTPEGIQFVDNWAVRRRVVPPYPATAGLPLLDARRLAEGEAAFLQFQAQVAEMVRPGVSSSALAGINARAYFRYLPAAGIIPLAGGSKAGFDYLNFLDGVTVRRIITEEGEFTYTHVEGAKVPGLLSRSFAYPAVDLDEEEFLWLYVVRENREAGDGPAATAPQLYLIMTSGHLPFVGDAQYDLSRWDYSNYGPIVGGTFIGG